MDFGYRKTSLACIRREQSADMQPVSERNEQK